MKWLLIFTLFIACASIHPVTEVYEKDNTILEKTDTVNLSTTLPTTVKTLKTHAALAAKNVALLLPFYTELLLNDTAYALANSIPKESELAVHYYEGVQLALDSLDKLGIKINLHTYDSGTDSFQVKKILSKPEIKDMDIIIGPLNNSSLTVTARFCEENKQYLFSPLSSSSPVIDNPYFILMNATLNTHCESLMHFMDKSVKPNNAILMYHHNSQEEVYAGYFKNYYTASGTTFRWTELTDKTDSSYYNKVGSFLTKNRNNIIVIPSFDEVFVNNMIRQLYALKDSFNITVLGMPTWSSMESLSIEYLQGLNTHITASFWLKYNSPDLNYFRSEYFAKYKSKPAEFTYQGYDLMYYIGSLLAKGENKFAERLQDTKVMLPGVRYDIQPVLSESGDAGNIQFYENKYVYILKYSNNALQEVR